MLLDRTQRIQLRSLWDDPKFAVVLQFLDNYQSILEKANTIGATEFETLQLSFQRTYQIILLQEIKRLLQEEAANVGVEE